MDFQLHMGWVPLAPMLVKGQLYRPQAEAGAT